MAAKRHDLRALLEAFRKILFDSQIYPKRLRYEHARGKHRIVLELDDDEVLAPDEVREPGAPLGPAVDWKPMPEKRRRKRSRD